MLIGTNSDKVFLCNVVAVKIALAGFVISSSVLFYSFLNRSLRKKIGFSVSDLLYLFRASL